MSAAARASISAAIATSPDSKPPTDADRAAALHRELTNLSGHVVSRFESIQRTAVADFKYAEIFELRPGNGAIYRNPADSLAISSALSSTAMSSEHLINSSIRQSEELARRVEKEFPHLAFTHNPQKSGEHVAHMLRDQLPNEPVKPEAMAVVIHDTALKMATIWTARKDTFVASHNLVGARRELERMKEPVAATQQLLRSVNELAPLVQPALTASVSLAPEEVARRNETAATHRRASFQLHRGKTNLRQDVGRRAPLSEPGEFRLPEASGY